MKRSNGLFVSRVWLAVVLAGAVGAPTGCAFKAGNRDGNGQPGSGGSSAISGLTDLQISPASATISVTSGGPSVTQQYKVIGTVNGQTQDLTGSVNYLASPPGIVTIDSHGLATTTGQAGGRVTIGASSGTVYAQATLVVNFSFTGADPGAAGAGVPTDAQKIVSGAPMDGARAPQLVYPNDGTLFPPNISGVEVHFTPGDSNTLFQVSFAGAFSTITTFVRCTAPNGINGCIYLPDAKLWASVASANAGQGPVKLTVTGTDDKGTAKGTSASFTLLFSKDNVEGALYYWTTSGKSAIMRWDFAGSTQAAMPYLTPTNTDGRTCVGCHALSPNGDKLVASAGGQSDGRLLLWNIATNGALQTFPLMQKSQFESWNADGTRFVGVYGDNLPGKRGASNLMIFDGGSGRVMSTIDLGGLRADHPDWSKSTDGPDTIVFTAIDPTAPTTDQKPATGAINVIQAANGTWGAPKELVPAQLGKNHYYPAIAPDGNLIVYNESTCTRGTPTAGQAPDVSCNADTDPTATMFVTNVGGMAPVALAAANRPGIADGATTDLTNSFPKWAPFIEHLDEDHKLIWMTFSSTRQYGLRHPPASTADTTETRTGTLIWMVGINPVTGDQDPSFPAFCLPFQDVATSNHIAQWAKYFIMGPG